MKVKGAGTGPEGEALGTASTGRTDTGRGVIGCHGMMLRDEAGKFCRGWSQKADLMWELQTQNDWMSG